MTEQQLIKEALRPSEYCLQCRESKAVIVESQKKGDPIFCMIMGIANEQPAEVEHEYPKHRFRKEIPTIVVEVRKATLDEVRERLVQNTGLLCSCKEVKHMGLIYSEECPTHVFILATLESKEK